MEKLYFGGHEYNMATKTIRIARQIEKTEKSETVTDAYKGEYETLKLALGADVLQDILGTSNFEDVDLNTMVKLYNAMIDGYDAEILEMQRERELQVLNSPAIKAINSVAKDIQAISNLEAKRKMLSK